MKKNKQKPPNILYSTQLLVLFAFGEAVAYCGLCVTCRRFFLSSQGAKVCVCRRPTAKLTVKQNVSLELQAHDYAAQFPYVHTEQCLGHWCQRFYCVDGMPHSLEHDTVDE